MYYVYAYCRREDVLTEEHKQKMSIAAKKRKYNVRQNA